METAGLLNSIISATSNIDSGRKCFAIRGKEREGRILYEDGISEAMLIFQQAQSAADPQALILSEYTFLTQELELCPKTDKDSIDSLTKAVLSFDDAFRSLHAVEKPGYTVADETYPNNGKYRVNNYPKDSYHIACIAHRTRLKNILRSPGIDPIEKALLKQRYANLTTAQSGYLQKQKKAIISKK